MSQPDLGTKRVCVSCGARFYDLHRSPAVCPKCGTEQPALVPRLRRSMDSYAATPVPAAPVKTNEEDIDLDTSDDDDDDDVLEDATDLDDDDDDISSDIDVNTDSEDHES
ncbi:TIGR02300 family protein [Acetobacter sp. TBRC 12305]|uniref:TIGR02300 family protein n=1 Tax=Acetobacter garciniae TaxID=2817435 RepID=A0A939KR43_9PROT|nr:TIGR02300 family protein [Acetobacter garciniae]MBO1324551.1 TIGR02300 family protein [Acetobacter garciniae]MBX0344240.1 TIGR02300 family protein [Acetobacter garciniae]